MRLAADSKNHTGVVESMGGLLADEVVDWGVWSINKAQDVVGIKHLDWRMASLWQLAGYARVPAQSIDKIPAYILSDRQVPPPVP